jgi:hypothetical protein
MITDNKLYNLYIKSNNEEKKVENVKKTIKFVKIVEKLPDLKNYQVMNNRQLCINSENFYHCNNKKLVLTNEILINFINKLISDLISNEILIKELLNIEEYFIQDIVDRNIFTERKS